MESTSYSVAILISKWTRYQLIVGLAQWNSLVLEVVLRTLAIPFHLGLVFGKEINVSKDKMNVYTLSSKIT